MRTPPKPVVQWTAKEPKRLRWATPIEFRAGNTYKRGGPEGRGAYVVVLVSHWAGYLRDVNDACAFCHGDPYGVNSPPDSLIVRERNSATLESPFTVCPNCHGGTHE
jgi:hypothetical protein